MERTRYYSFEINFSKTILYFQDVGVGQREGLPPDDIQQSGGGDGTSFAGKPRESDR